MLADLALETLPVERAYILVLSVWRFFLLLSENPIFQALEMDKTDSTFAFASYDQWICRVLLRTPANSALNLVFDSINSFLFNILETSNFLSFFEFLVIELSFTHLNLIALEIFYSEAHSSKFDGVKFLNLVVVFPGFVFERPGDKPESVYAFFFLSGSCSCMVKVVSFCIFLKKT